MYLIAQKLNICVAAFLVKFSGTILKQCPLHFVTLPFRLHARNITYFGKISFLNLAHQTSSIFPHLNVKSAISTSILLLTVRKNLVRKKRKKKTFLDGFMLKSNEKPHWLLSLGYGYFPAW